MGKYLLIETRSVADGGLYSFDVARQLRALERDVTVYLTEDAVFAARAGAPTGEQLITEARRRSVALLVDVRSLQQRGISSSELSTGVRVSQMDQLVDVLMDTCDTAMWH